MTTDAGYSGTPLVRINRLVPAGQGIVLVHGGLESLQEVLEVVHEVGARGDVPRHRDARVQARARLASLNHRASREHC